jgi:hypothetical protein
MDIFIPEHKEILLALVKHRVDFMLIGGYAVIHYGYERSTADLDIWLQLGNDNRDRLLNALEEFGITDDGIAELRKMDFTRPLPVFWFGQPPKTIDFVTLVSNVKFEEAIKEVRFFFMGNEKIPIIHYTHLILSKSTSSRLKDKADVEELERINKYRKG